MTLRVQIAGVGTYGPGFGDMDGLKQLLVGDVEAAEFAPPKPERIPPRERRRAPMLVRLAVEVADQACRNAGLEPQSLPSVFASAYGDTDITDNMCRTVADRPELLSPTRFHNSVHNAAAGYWSISTGTTAPANSVSALEYTASVGLLEAALMACQDARPVLLVLFDRPTPPPLAFQEIRQPFGAALVVAPVSDAVDGVLELETTAESVQWPQWHGTALADLYENNPSARILPLLMDKRIEAMALPLSAQTALRIKTL